nr:reverse transcriptase domain-containing protein [Tanacetum cinerariifolium]
MRADESAKTYLLFSQLLKEFDREDLENLWKVVKAKHGYKCQKKHMKDLWSDLKVMFEPHEEDAEALAAYKATHAANALKAKNQSQNGSDRDNGNRGNGKGGNGNGENENGKNKNPNENNSDARQLMKIMAEVYYPINEIQKMESELWNLTVKNNDLAAYTQRFLELTMMCTKMVLVKEDRVEKFIGGLPDNIQRNVATEPMRLQDAVRIANNLMDQKLKGYATAHDIAHSEIRYEIKPL